MRVTNHFLLGPTPQEGIHACTVNLVKRHVCGSLSQREAGRYYYCLQNRQVKLPSKVLCLNHRLALLSALVREASFCNEQQLLQGLLLAKALSISGERIGLGCHRPLQHLGSLWTKGRKNIAARGGVL